MPDQVSHQHVYDVIIQILGAACFLQTHSAQSSSATTSQATPKPVLLEKNEGERRIWREPPPGDFVLKGRLISSFFFRFAHLYQGRGGIIRTGAVGLVFGFIYIASGSLVPGQILDTLLDLNNGLALSKIVSRVVASPAM